jgi:hypothetical protein
MSSCSLNALSTSGRSKYRSFTWLFTSSSEAAEVEVDGTREEFVVNKKRVSAGIRGPFSTVQKATQTESKIDGIERTLSFSRI